MTRPTFEPRGTTAEVGRRTHVLRSLAVLVTMLAVLGAGGWLVAGLTDDSATVTASERLAVPAAGFSAADPVAADSATDAVAAETLAEPVTAERLRATVAPPVLTGAHLVTAGEPVEVSIAAPTELQLVQDPAAGLLHLEAGGRIIYVPRDGFVGSDSFTVTSCNPGGCGDARVTIDVLPAGTSAYVNAPATRLVDSRTGDPLTAGSTISVQLPSDASYEAVALSITLAGSLAAGSVLVDGGAGPVAALSVAGPAAMTTNLVIVPVTGDAVLNVTTTAGGHVVADMVGYFETKTESAHGRFVQTEPVRAARLVTATDGRQATVDTTDLAGLPADQVGAILVLVTADVGADGGQVRLGPGVEQYDQMLMWGAPTGPNLQRRGVVLLTPDAEGTFSFNYQGGTQIDVDVLGYFTNGSAPSQRAGLYVPSELTEVIRGDFPEGSIVVGSVPDYAAAAFVTLTAEPGVFDAADPRDLGIASGRTIGTALSVGPDPGGTGQGLVVSSSHPLSAQLQVLGLFLTSS